MGGLKRIGIMLILTGFFIPLVMYPFTELIPELKEIHYLHVFAGKNYTPRLNELIVGSVRYPYIIALGLTIIFVGIGIYILSGKKNSKG